MYRSPTVPVVDAATEGDPLATAKEAAIASDWSLRPEDSDGGGDMEGLRLELTARLFRDDKTTAC